MIDLRCPRVFKGTKGPSHQATEGFGTDNLAITPNAAFFAPFAPFARNFDWSV